MTRKTHPSDAFEDALWKAASEFHDAQITNLEMDIKARTLAVCLLSDFDWPEGRPAEPALVRYEFVDVERVELTNEATADPVFSDYVFPVTSLVDSFEICDRNPNRQTTYFAIKGMYAWQLRWWARGFSRTVEPVARLNSTE
jgi:hypothetical protein